MTANKRQVAGSHYRKHGALQHWDIVLRFDLDYFQGQITKYVMRWKDKNGVQDLQKAAHFLEKYIESNTAVSDAAPTPSSASVFGLRQRTAHAYFDGEVSPTGWTGFVFEGVDHNGFLYTCRECKIKFYTPENANPYDKHLRETGCTSIVHCADDGEPTSAYTGQD